MNHAQLRLHDFYKYGYLGGGMLPVAWVALTHLFGHKLVSERYIPPFSLAVFLLIAISVVLSMAMATCESKPNLANIVLRIAAGISFLALHLLVLTTGGSIQSVFAYHYLYIPAVVAISLPADRDFYGACLISASSFAINLIASDPMFAVGPLPGFMTFSPSADWKAIETSSVYRYTFLIIFLIQIVMLGLLNKKQSSGKLLQAASQDSERAT